MPVYRHFVANKPLNYIALENSWKSILGRSRVRAGLVNRRRDEWELFTCGDYVRNY